MPSTTQSGQMLRAYLSKQVEHSLTCLNRSKGRDSEGVPVRKIARLLRLTAEMAASVWRASGGLSLVRSVWLSSAMTIVQPLLAKQCCINTGIALVYETLPERIAIAQHLLQGSRNKDRYIRSNGCPPTFACPSSAAQTQALQFCKSHCLGTLP